MGLPFIGIELREVNMSDNNKNQGRSEIEERLNPSEIVQRMDPDGWGGPGPANPSK